MATAELERTNLLELTAEERVLAAQSQTERHIMGAAYRLEEQGIKRLAVVGPEDGADADLARQLDVDDIDIHPSIGSMMIAVYEKGVAGLLTRGRGSDAHDTSLVDIWRQSGHASIAHILLAGTGTSTDVLVSHRSPNNEGVGFALEVLRENTGTIEIEQDSTQATLAREGLHVVAQAMQMAYPSRGSVAIEPPIAKPRQTYFVDTNF